MKNKNSIRKLPSFCTTFCCPNNCQTLNSKQAGVKMEMIADRRVGLYPKSICSSIASKISQTEFECAQPRRSELNFGSDRIYLYRCPNKLICIQHSNSGTAALLAGLAKANLALILYYKYCRTDICSYNVEEAI